MSGLISDLDLQLKEKMMSEEEFVAELAEKYTKEELIDRVIKQFESTKVVISILTVLCNDDSTGSDRALARINGREVIKVYNELSDI